MPATMSEVQHELSPLPQSPASVLTSTPFEHSNNHDRQLINGPAHRVFEAATVAKSRRLLITVCIIATNLVQMISNMVCIAGGLVISEALGVDAGPGNANWVAASYMITQGTFVLISGRLGEVYGHRNIMLIGGVWFILWSLINGFCINFIAFNIARAMSGIGGALIMPNAVAMISITCPPGKMRNVSLGFFSASAPMAGSIGSIFAGVILQYASWKWLFFIMAILGFCVFNILYFLVPSERPINRNGKIDWVGASLGSAGLISFNFAWNQAPAVGWITPYEIPMVIISVVLIGIFGFWELRLAKVPIMPLGIWKAPSFLPLILVVLLSFMSFGTLLWYMIAWQQEVRNWNVLQFGIGWIPFGIFGTVGAISAGWLIPRLAAQWILAIGLFSVMIPNLLLATMPDQQTYWAAMFVATIVMGFCPDFIYTAAQIIASNGVSRSQQGTAASLIGLLNLYGNSLGLGFAGTVETVVNKRGGGETKGFRAALYFAVALAGVALILNALLVRMDKDEREGWEDPEDNQLADSQAQGTSTATERRV